MAEKFTKDHGVRLTYSVLISWITIGGAVWFFAKPILMSEVSLAMNDQIEMTVEDAVEDAIDPLNAAFKVLLRNQINSLRRQIAAMEYRQRNSEEWTVEDAQSLVDHKLELESLQAAYREL